MINVVEWLKGFIKNVKTDPLDRKFAEEALEAVQVLKVLSYEFSNRPEIIEAIRKAKYELREESQG